MTIMKFPFAVVMFNQNKLKQYKQSLVQCQIKTKLKQLYGKTKLKIERVDLVTVSDRCTIDVIKTNWVFI